MTQFKHGSIMANGINIQYYRSGGDKPAVVFLHGITEHGLAWTRFPSFIEPSILILQLSKTRQRNLISD